MKKELKQAIINFIFDNEKEFQLINATIDKFIPYIYDKDGEYLIGGQEVNNFITQAVELITNN